jgi:prepilin-type N-terminal cleavage/methylation domain-containing protein
MSNFQFPMIKCLYKDLLKVGTMNKTSGFTLIEVIVSLIIVGIMAAIAGMGIVTGTKGYIQTKENVHTAQKAHLAITRIKRELMELTGIAAKNDAQPWVIFDNPTGRLAIAKVADTLEMYFNLGPTQTTLPADGDLLVDNVQSFSINYFKGPAPWLVTDDIDLLSALQATLVLNRNDGSGQTISFATTINPRNTNNFGGAPPTTAPFTAPQYECFVATAAYGQPHHPMVLLLRQFRDRYLLPWQGGRILANAYYALGPKLATAIKDRAWARKTARFFLLPIVGWVYLWMHNPVAIPFILIFSWLMSHMIFRWFHQYHRKLSPVADNNQGNVLVGLVVTMLIFAVMAAGMVSLTSTSTSNQVTSNSTARAYYLAESGFRYAASEYLNTGDLDFDGETIDNRNQRFETLHDVEFTLSNPNEKFRLRFYPYYFTTTVNHTPGNSSIQIKFSGAQPADLTVPATGKLEIGSYIYSYGSYNAGTGVFGSLSPVLQETIIDNMSVTPVANPSGSETVTQNDTLTLSDASAFPIVNGIFKINGDKYAYVSRNGNILQNITDAEEPSQPFSVDVTSSTDVVLWRFIKVISLGTVGQHDLKATRQITYNVPLPWKPEKVEKVEFYDPFDDTSHLNASTFGSHGVVDIGGDSALKVTSTDFTSLSAKASLISINWSSTRVNFASAHLSAGRFLSYDAQTKIGLDSPFIAGNWSDGNEEGTAPDGLPKYFMAGIAFRLDENLNTYGVGFTRGSTNRSPTPDNIGNDLMPQDQTPMVVLWQQTNDGATQDWLAYSVLPGSIIFSDDSEVDTGLWVADSPWTRATNFKHSGDYSWTTSPSGTYSDPLAGTWNDSLTSQTIDLSGFDSALLSFWHRHRIESGNDFGHVEISSNDGATWNTLASYTSNQDIFDKVIFDISSYVGGSTVKIRFRFERNCCLTRDGWWIDDVQIITKELLDFSPGQNEGTLMVRVIEAAVVDFTSGGTTEIKAGDKVSQSNGALGTVIFPPVLESGSWAAGDATGMLWLNKTSSPLFFPGTLDVLGKGSNLATVISYKERTNLIKAYYNTANPTDTGGPYTDPYDLERLANGRGTLRWPADEGQITDNTNDYFTLLEWNIDINSSAVPSIQRLRDENGKYTIISIDTLSTPANTYFPYNRPELGLFALGHGAIRVYFDDLGVQLYVISGGGRLKPVQQ